MIKFLEWEFGNGGFFTSYLYFPLIYTQPYLVVYISYNSLFQIYTSLLFLTPPLPISQIPNIAYFL